MESLGWRENYKRVSVLRIERCALPSQEKCARYWPAQGSEEYGNLEVTLVTASTLDNYVSTVLRLRNLDTREERSLRHFRLTCWPHQGVPKQTKPITEFLR